MRVRTAREFDSTSLSPDDQEVRDPLQRVLADFKADLLVSQVCFDPKSLIFQDFSNTARKFRLAVRDIEHHRLHRREPAAAAGPRDARCRMPQKRSREPNIARCSMTGMRFWLSSPM